MSSGILVIVEHDGGEINKVSLELISKGRELADKLNCKLTALVLGLDEFNSNASSCQRLSRLAHFGADDIVFIKGESLKHYTTDAYATEITNFIKVRKPEIVLVGATYQGRDLAPRVAGRLRTGLTADCTGLEIDGETKNLLMTRPAFGGNIMATIECPNHRPQMSTIRPGVFKLNDPDINRIYDVEVIEESIKSDEIRIIVEKIVKEAKKKRDIQEAEIIVSGGRGLSNPEGFDVLKELADEIGGTIGSSRVAVDLGWIDKSHQVGQTGKTIRPRLYIACGISGAIQHLAGMSESDFIIAINKDESAPIMTAADIGICGDLFKVVPKLTQEIRKYKNSFKCE